MARKISFKPTSRRSSHVRTARDRLARHWKRDCALQSICPGDTGFRHPQHRTAAAAEPADDDALYDALYPTDEQAAEYAERLVRKQDPEVLKLRQAQDYSNTLMAGSAAVDDPLYDTLFGPDPGR